MLHKLSIDKSEIIAIGDFYNDLEMIEFAGLGIAMGNAPDDLKDKANVVTSSNNEDGVFYALEKYLF
ncbi:HAD hydrolase family protein [Alkalihalobacillus sp. APA_J-10(15)]|nr:HAD hydrolase family protein [Halalkalibacter sp. APA_J-10(15)]